MPDRAIVHQLGAQIPWKHNCVLLDRLKDAETREFYIRKTLEHGWSRSVLIHQLDSELHKRWCRGIEFEIQRRLFLCSNF